ncbi:UNKNOWN [Stylonychia lemnae]|uniref:Uncharacterized protein n=1 Tax=Stylonychia lemnae TaxID=5949 RepID=A0A077ZQS9_STYLE|nr:UNKNOWN [Stylonychia lemnae]|eukprot:CDW72262.1 UNKNOWN [Stylonychia lemnae]
MDSQSKRITQARYQYYLKKKKAKIKQLKEILIEKRKEKGLNYDDKNPYSPAKGNLSPKTIRSPYIRGSIDNNMSASHRKNLSYSQLETRNKVAFMTQVNESSSTQMTTDRVSFKNIILKPMQNSDIINPYEQSAHTNHIIYEKKLNKTNSQLENKELVVNKEPDIPLKVNLDFKNPELFINQKIVNLEKMTSAMVKLDTMADDDKERFENKLKERRRKVMKLKELLNEEEFERERRIQKEKERQKNALLSVERQQQNMEKKAYQDYQEYLKQRMQLQKEKEKQEHELSKIKFKEMIGNMMKEKEQETFKDIVKKQEQDEVQTHLQIIDEKLHQKSQKYLQTLTQIRESRSQYNLKHNRVRTLIIDKNASSEIENMKEGYKKISKVKTKAQKVYDNRKELQESLSQYNTIKLETKRKQYEEIMKEKESWSQTVLQKHQKIEDQVMLRNKSIEEHVKARKEYNNLRFMDQFLNYSDIIDEKRRRQEMILKKHEVINLSLLSQKRKYDELQQSQRFLEIQKKREMFSDYQFQSLKPQNKVLDVSLKRQILADEPVARSRAMIKNIRFNSTSE